MILVALVLAAPAAAEPVRPQPVIKWTPVLNPPAALPSSRIIFVHKCPFTGCLIKPGIDDSRVDTSTIAEQQVTISKFKQSDVVWDKMMTCVKNTYAPFDITVTDVDPGTVPHYENVVGGSSGAELHPDFAGAGGVSPFTCGEIPNSISFTFDVYGADPDQLCWTVAQETAHSFGLEHEYNEADPLTYISGGPSMKRFQATDSKCGTFAALASCACSPNAPTQNSYKRIVAMFGPGAATPPTITITSPTNGKTIQPNAVVRVNATDDVAVDHVELWIDNVDSGVKAKTAPYRLTLPDGVEDGAHTLELRAIDVQGVPASAMVDVDMGPPCTASSGCSGDDVCVMGVCHPGPSVPGGLGDTCTADAECLSTKCVGSTANDRLCVESCELGTAGVCPNDFECIAGGTSGVCYYNGSGGCCSAGTEPTGPILLGASVFGLVLLRRRRRR
ncbi:MAG: Ig-like domain-containing protein [Polyangiales bacterium]